MPHRITDITLVIGDLTSIVDDSVQFYFDLLSQDTLAAGARLHFRRQSANATCWECGHQFAVTPPLAIACERCGSPRLQVSGGREFHVESIEIEESAATAAAEGATVSHSGATTYE